MKLSICVAVVEAEFGVFMIVSFYAKLRANCKDAGQVPSLVLLADYVEVFGIVKSRTLLRQDGSGWTHSLARVASELVSILVLRGSTAAVLSDANPAVHEASQRFT
jgi:hypothetical protein